MAFFLLIWSLLLAAAAGLALASRRGSVGCRAARLSCAGCAGCDDVLRRDATRRGA